ncbi:hypothetical protein ABZP36_005473 [Zizania latifolia]
MALSGGAEDDTMGLFDEAQCPTLSPPQEIPEERIAGEDSGDLYGDHEDDDADTEAEGQASDGEDEAGGRGLSGCPDMPRFKIESVVVSVIYLENLLLYYSKMATSVVPS